MQDALSHPTVAVFADIHGNFEALRVALRIVDDLRIDQLLFLGDLLGYYYQSSECLRELQNYQLYSVLGNHEEMYLRMKEGALDSNAVELKYGSSLGRTLALDDANLNFFVESLPLVRDLKYKEVSLRMAHGDFDSCSKYVYPDAPKSQIEFADIPGVDFVLLGNTHMQMLRVGKWTHLVNPGSIGMCRSRLNNVQFSTINLVTKEIVFHNVDYSPVETLEQVAKFDPNCGILKKYLQ